MTLTPGRATRSPEIAAFAKRLRSVRVSRGLAQTEIGRAVSGDKSYVANLESGRHGAWIPKFLRLCAVLRCTPNDLLLEEENA